MENIVTMPPLERKQKSSGTRKFVFNTFAYVLIVVMLVIVLPKGLAWALHTPYPMAAVTSGSMWPAMSPGSLVFVQGVQKSDIKVGDIIVYYNGNVAEGFTIHRVAKLNDNTLVTKGDANFTQDTPIAYDKVVGRSVSVFGKPLTIPYLGSITIYINNLRHGKNI